MCRRELKICVLSTLQRSLLGCAQGDPDSDRMVRAPTEASSLVSKTTLRNGKCGSLKRVINNSVLQVKLWVIKCERNNICEGRPHNVHLICTFNILLSTSYSV